MRPDRLIVVTGTATEIGKTWVAAGLLRALRSAGRRVAARKPVQSYDPLDHEPRDADVLAAATGEPPAEVCPPTHSLGCPLAPPIAARELGRVAPSLDALVQAAEFAAVVDVGVVEGVGGLFSPIADEADTLTLIERIEPDIVLVVADSALGTIHDITAVRRGLGSRPQVVFLNRYDPTVRVHELNAEWLRDRGVAVAVSIDELVARLTLG